MKAPTRFFIAAALALASAAATGCGDRTYFDAPVPEGDAKGASSEKAPTGVAITVIDQTSKPVVGATVGIADASGKLLAADVATDDAGKATFAKLPPGKGYVATARHKGLAATHALDVEGEAQVLVSIMITAANGLKGTLSGTVIDGFTGQPLHGALVSVVGMQNTTRSNADGSYVLKDVPAGNPIVVAAFPGFAEQRTMVAVRGGQLVRSDVRLKPGSNNMHFGQTLIATAQTIVKVDRVGSKLWTTRKGGAQARLLANGNVLVANGGGVDEVTFGGKVAWSYKPLVFGRLNNAQGVFRAASGNTFIADTDNNRVIEVSTSQQIQRSVKFDFRKPMSVERLEASHTTLVADTGNNRVVEVDDAGRVIWGFGDGNPENLNHPTHAVRLPNGNTLVTDSGNSRILEITRESRLAWDYGDNTRATCAFPNAATRLPNGNTLVADTGNHRVIEVDRNRQIVWTHEIDAPLFAERL